MSNLTAELFLVTWQKKHGISRYGYLSPDRAAEFAEDFAKQQTPTQLRCPEHGNQHLHTITTCNAEGCLWGTNAAPQHPKLELRDYATGVQGSYCIGRKVDYYWQFWNPGGEWAGSGYVFTDKKLAEAIMVLL